MDGSALQDKSELEDIAMESIQDEILREKEFLKSEQSIIRLWGNFSSLIYVLLELL